MTLVILLLSVHTATAQDIPDSTRLDVEKLKLEKLKVWLTALSIFIPAIIAIISISWQTRTNAKLKQTDTRAAFQLKAAEIVLNSTGPNAAANRTKVIEQLFKDYLPSNFAESLNLKGLPGTMRRDKLKLLELVIANPTAKKEIIEHWKGLFPWDIDWVHEVFEAGK